MAEYIKGIDVSRWQGSINWEAAAADGVKFAFIKAGGSDAGFYEDPMFQINMIQAHDAGVKIGVYYYVGPNCTSFDDGEADGLRLVMLCAKWKSMISLPLVIDFEAPTARDKSGNTAAVRGFAKAVADAGYFPMVYASEISGFRDRLNTAALPDLRKWCAKWSVASPATVAWDVWQQTSEGRVDGISCPVDIDYYKPEAWDAIVLPQTELDAALRELKAAIEKVERLL